MTKRNFTISTVLVFILFVFTIKLQAEEKFKTTADLNLRTGPGPKYQSIGIVSKGEEVNVIDTTNSSWFKIEYKGKEGFLSSKYLSRVVVEPVVTIKPSIVKPKIPESSNGIYYLVGIVGLIIIIWAFKAVNKKEEEVEIPLIKPKTPTVLRQEMNKNNLNNIKFTVTVSSTPNDLKKDDSIIDITNESYQIPKENNANLTPVVPYWKHAYVFSFAEINNATNEQKNFYTIFKNNFLNGKHLNIEGNDNYAFILLFDLLDCYKAASDYYQLEKQLNVLSLYYPKTKSYAIPLFIKKLEEKKDKNLADILRQRHSIYEKSNANSNTGYSYEADDWKLGTKYKVKLKLNDEDIKLLNLLWSPSNNFCNIEFCCIEIVKLFLTCINELKNNFILEGTTFQDQCIDAADIIARKQFNYRKGSNNYKYCIDSLTGNGFHSIIFKHCENLLREHYGHKRKINTESEYTHPEAKEAFESKILIKVAAILPNLTKQISSPDEATEIELNSQNTNRWKIKFEEITNNYKEPKLFIDKIKALAALNKENPSIENIFFEASKFISKHDRESALTLYVYYLHYDLKSENFDNKELTKTVQKSLFKTNEQLENFRSIVNTFIKDKNIETALNGVADIFKIKRKKIQLNVASIKEVQQQHSGTVELLNEYLKDEDQVKSVAINDNDTVVIATKPEVAHKSIYSIDIPFSSLHVSVLEIFAKHNFSVPQADIDIFAKSKGVFKNQLVESLNETCYETLDDILIEEEDNFYIINSNYYQKILAK